MTVLTGSQIEAARLLTLRQMLKLELKGLSKSKGPTAYSTLKMMGFKGRWGIGWKKAHNCSKIQH